MIKRPIITVREWAAKQEPPIPERTALEWASRGHLPAYQSPLSARGTWLCPADAPNPGPLPQGAPAHRKK